MWGVKPLSVFRAPWAAERILAVLPEQNGRVRIEQWTPPQTEEAADEPRRLARIDRFLWARPMHRTVLVAQLVPPDKHYSGRRTRLLLLGGDGDTTPLGILPGRPRRDDVFLLVNER
jgi:hypothetical protein